MMMKKKLLLKAQKTLQLSKLWMKALISKAILVKLWFLMMTVLTNLTKPEPDDKVLEEVDVDATLTMKTPTKIESSNMETQSKIQYCHKK